MNNFILKLCNGKTLLSSFNKNKIFVASVNYLNQKYVHPLQLQHHCYSKTIPDSEKPIDKFPEGRYSIKVWQGRQPPKGRVYKSPVDWLPFEWHRLARIDILEESGDLEKMPDVDINLPKPDFDLSDELKDAPEQVKSIFSLKTATRHELTQVELDNLVRQVQRHPLDFTSLEVLITRWTVRIRFLFRCRIQTGKPKKYKVRLRHAIQRRNQYLRILYNLDRERFNWLTKILKVEFEPLPLELPLIRYTKKWDLRRLTKEYCKKEREKKLSSYHEELKSMQEAFLREKEETLAWIAKEEKELGVYEADKINNSDIK